MHHTRNSCSSVSAKTSSVHRAPRSVTLLDPVFRCGLLEIPLEKTYATKGRDEWLDGRLNKDLSLCCLFQKGRCHAQERCFQVHVDRDFMAALRDQQSRIVSCCRHCNDTASLSSQAMNFFSANIPSATQIRVTYQNSATRIIDSNAVAYSAGLVQQFEEHNARVDSAGFLEIPSRRICRLHLRGCCKYGKDCKNVHACSKLGESFLDAPNIAVVAPSVVPRVHAAPAALPRPTVVTTAAPAVAPKSSPPLSSFAFVGPTTPAALPAKALSNPLGFGLMDRNNVSMSLKSMDAVDFCELSTRMMKSLLFDATAALEDSAKTGHISSDVSSSMGDSSEASLLMAATSPGQKRRAATSHAVHLDAMHPCSQQQLNDFLTSCRVPHWDQWNTMSMFA